VEALLAQLESVVRDPRANADRAAAALAAHPDVGLAVFPELFLSAYDLDAVGETALAPDAEELRTVAAAAAQAGTAVVIGFAERLERGGYANSAACIDADGSLAAIYRKTQLYAREGEVFERGADLRLVRLAGLAVAPLVCFDVEFPELARALAVAGAELLVTASANMEPYGDEHEIATRARALENRLPHVYVDAVGEIGPNRFVGRSRSIGPGGDVLALAGAGEELLVAPVAPADADPNLDYLRALPPPLAVVGPTALVEGARRGG
jgi:predicted amidohydrolase